MCVWHAHEYACHYVESLLPSYFYTGSRVWTQIHILVRKVPYLLSPQFRFGDSFWKEECMLWWHLTTTDTHKHWDIFCQVCELQKRVTSSMCWRQGLEWYRLLSYIFFISFSYFEGDIVGRHLLCYTRLFNIFFTS